MTAVTDLRCEYRRNPLGIDVAAPRLSWRLDTERPGARQIAYRIQVATNLALLETSAPAPGVNLWDSGRVESDRSVHVVYEGVPLASRQRAHWRVTVWDENDDATISTASWWEMGLLTADAWQAEWIGGTLTGGPRTGVPAPYLRKGFQAKGEIAAARLYVTALGLYECSINGQRVGDEVFRPGWTDYRKRVQYQVYDVTDLVADGHNVIGAVLGDGWAVGHVGDGHRQGYVDRPRFIAQLEVEQADGHVIVVATDETWKHQFGPLLANDFLMGEAYDARLEMPGWDRCGFDDAGWLPVDVFADGGAQRVATNGPAVKRTGELQPVDAPHGHGHGRSSRVVLDFGQNLVGWVRLRAAAPAGTTVTMRFAEALDERGGLYTANLRGARATDYYTFRGDGEEVWEPKFTFHGFRYVELVGLPLQGELPPGTVTAIVVHSEMEQTGDFSCSDPLVNQLQHNIQWGQKGNFVDVPTDCPQRAERLGWTGDIQVFARTGAFNMDIAGFMTKWARDLADAQSPDGAVPPVVPTIVFNMPDGGPAWADAAIICPWTMYLTYGDTRILEENYDVMRQFLDWVIAASPDYIRCAPSYGGWLGFGDWLSINADTPRDLIGTAFLAYDAKLMAQIAAVLGRAEDEAKYRMLFSATKEAFASRFLAGAALPDDVDQTEEARGRVAVADAISQGNLRAVEYDAAPSRVFNTELFAPTQTAYVLALHFDLLPDRLRPVAVAELADDIYRRDGHLSTGFVGTSYLPHALSANGRLDVAYELLLQTTWPSWLHPVTQGATTIWERWDGWTEENGFQDPQMNSFNHYAFGSIGAWLYNTVAGIELDPQQPGYKHTLLRPQPGGGLTNATGRINTLYGELMSEWTIDDGTFAWTVVIPPNTTATATLPPGLDEKIELDGEQVTGSMHELRPGEHHLMASITSPAS